MRNEKPNVTVIYQDASSKAPGFLAIVGEVLAFGLFLGIAIIIGSCGMWR